MVGQADIVDQDFLQWVSAGRHDYIKDATEFMGRRANELMEAEGLECLHDLASVDICSSFEVDVNIPSHYHCYRVRSQSFLQLREFFEECCRNQL